MQRSPNFRHNTVYSKFLEKDKEYKQCEFLITFHSTAFVGLCVYCLFATSKDISIGPTGNVCDKLGEKKEYGLFTQVIY